MLFGILGPLLVRAGDAVMAVPAARQRVLLAVLLLHAGRAVSPDELAETMWDGAPSAGAAATLRTHVMRLRRVLGPQAGARVITRYPGYLVDAGEEEVDLLRFARLCREGGAAVRAGAWAEASGTLGEALGLWRGEPLADIPSQILRRDEAPQLEQLRLQALEWRNDAQLHLGGHAELLPRLQSLAAEHPLRERFQSQLMLALYRCGRQADALAAYQHARRVLVDELGAEPGTELRKLHQQILIADATLALRDSARLDAGGTRPVVPRELPATVQHFAGRTAELAELTGLLGRPEEPPGTVVISAIGGTAGVGKTALAVHWAHRVAQRFPDGQLYVNLRGYDPGQPMPAADALAGFLRSLGVAGQDIPADAGERAARYRSLLAGRRMLVVLDNAGSVDQVRPLLPGASACVAVVTSRDALTGLVARDGAARLDLDLLPLADAVGLLRALTGVRVDAEPSAASALAGHCCRLPLALRVAAELAAARPAASLADLAAELADQQRRLDLLDAGEDPRTAVRAVFSWSYRHLEAGAARAFRLAGLHPGPDLDHYAAAALTDSTPEQGRRLHAQLARAHLVEPTAPGRYALHDLLRSYAHELAIARDSEPDRRAVLTRLFDYYLHTAGAATDTLFPAEVSRRPRMASAAGPAPPVTGPAAARAWLDTERANLVAAAVHAASHGWPDHAAQLAAILFRYLDVGGYYPEAITIHSHARRAASQLSDHAAEATALTSLGAVDIRQGRYQQATGYLQQAASLFRQAGDRAGEARALGNLGTTDLQQGRTEQASSHLQQAASLFRQAGDRTGEAHALGTLGILDIRQGRYDLATSHLQQALNLCRETGYLAGEIHALSNLGEVDMLQGRDHQATERLQQALALCREGGDRAGEANVLADLGPAELRQGRHQQAADHLRQALDRFREAGDRGGEARARNGLGQVLLATGQPARARTEHEAALGLASQIGEKLQEAHAHNGLGNAYHARDEPGPARDHWRQALTLYTQLGAPEAGRVRAHLTGSDGDEGFGPLPP
jgi:DNA-binding SARP family transcriptional activator/Tfp pilus assembly protein PilF